MIQLWSRFRHLRWPQSTRKATARAVAEGDAARDRKDWGVAALAYKTALGLDETLAHIWVQYGHALKEGGDKPAAEQAYRRALSILPHESDTHLQLGHVLKLQGRRMDATEAYLRALDEEPSNVVALAELRALGITLSELRQRIRPRSAPASEARRVVLTIEGQSRDLVPELAAIWEAAEMSAGALTLARFAEGQSVWIDAATQEPLSLETHDVLVSLDTPSANMLAAIRQAIRDKRLLFCPLVALAGTKSGHEEVLGQKDRDEIDSIRDVVRHASAILVPSEIARRRIEALAKAVPQHRPTIRTIGINALPKSILQAVTAPASELKPQSVLIDIRNLDPMEVDEVMLACTRVIEKGNPIPIVHIGEISL